MGSCSLPVATILVAVMISNALVVTSVVTNYWDGVADGSFHNGLLFDCFGENCHFIEFFQDTDTELVRLGMLGACGLAAIGILLIFLQPCSRKDLLFPIGVIQLCSMLLSIGCTSYYTYHHRSRSIDLKNQWSFYVSWIGSSVLAMSLMMLLVLATRKKPMYWEGVDV